MGTYIFVPHTADEKFIVTAETLEDAFATCVSAFYEVIIPKQTVEKDVTKKIVLQAKRLRSLLYDFLNELVFYYDDQDLILQHVESLSITSLDEGYRLEAMLVGDKHYKYDVQMEIKNMTYSDMTITGRGTEDGDQTKDVEITVVVDI